jgi:hypothetical protein
LKREIRAKVLQRRDTAEQNSGIGEHAITPKFGNESADRRSNKNPYPDR